MKKLLTLTLLLAVPAVHGAEDAKFKAKAAQASSAPFAALQEKLPTIGRLGDVATSLISELPIIPDNPMCSREEALDTLSLVDRACMSLATGTPEEQALIGSCDKVLGHGETALPLLIKVDKESVLKHMAAGLAQGTEDEQLFIKSVTAVIENSQVALSTLAKMDKRALASHACAGLSAGTEDEQALGKELEALLTHGYGTVGHFLSTDKEALLAKPEIQALKNRLIMLAIRAAQQQGKVAVLSPEAVVAIQKPLLAQIEQLKAQIADLQKERDAQQLERMKLLEAVMMAMQGGKKARKTIEPCFIEYSGDTKQVFLIKKEDRDERKS